MGSQAAQAKLWGQRPEDWANIQEPTGMAGYDYAIDFLKLTPADKLLDVGCGSGLFSEMAHKTGAQVTGVDATSELIEQAKKRNPTIPFQIAEMEELTFNDDTFDVVCGFNSFQYAANVVNAFTEAKRVLKPGGRLVVMIWGDKEDCEATSYLKTVGSLLPPPPPGAPGPFALTDNHLLEKTLEETGFKNIHQEDIPSIWDYPDFDIAMRGLLSAGPAARAIEHSGFEKAYATLKAAVQPYIQPNGHIVYKNKVRLVTAVK